VTKDIILDVQEQEVITRDNAVILTNAIAFIKVTDPVKAVYGVTDFSEAIRNLIMTTLRSIVGEMELDEALSSRDKIKARLRESIADEAVDWGLTVKSVEIQDIKPSQSMQKAMEMQAAAERERKAVVTRSEGAKQSAILEAEARLESAKRDANAQVMLAEASAEAIRRITAAIGDQTGPMSYMLGEKYIARWNAWARRTTPSSSSSRPTSRKRCAGCSAARAEHGKFPAAPGRRITARAFYFPPRRRTACASG
jgi:regulator of protease activity HflC (stomatin/prohibitin superfamily)